jgi:hypothetical protein
LDDGLVLFSEHHRRLYHLNPSAAYIWCCQEDGLAPDAIARDLAQTFGVGLDQARHDVHAALSQWRALRSHDRGPSHEPGGDTPKPPQRAKDAGPLGAASPVPGAEPLLTQVYGLIDTRFRLRYACSEALQRVVPNLEHLRADPGPGWDMDLEIQAREGTFLLLKDGRCAGQCDTVQGLTPLAHGVILMSALQARRCVFVFHAAALAMDAEAVLLPGAPGSGKSTLAAALMNSGLSYCTDELVVLDDEDGRVHPAPVSIGLKEGAWEVLAPYDPRIRDLPIHLRTDGRSIRYLPPRREALPAGHKQRYGVRAIVFPSYQEGRETTHRRLGPGEALCRLTQAGYDATETLDPTRVGWLVDWIEHRDCFALSYSKLPEAVERIRGLFR